MKRDSSWSLQFRNRRAEWRRRTFGKYKLSKRTITQILKLRKELLQRKTQKKSTPPSQGTRRAA